MTRPSISAIPGWNVSRFRMIWTIFLTRLTPSWYVSFSLPVSLRLWPRSPIVTATGYLLTLHSKTPSSMMAARRSWSSFPRVAESYLVSLLDSISCGSQTNTCFKPYLLLKECIQTAMCYCKCSSVFVIERDALRHQFLIMEREWSWAPRFRTPNEYLPPSREAR